MALPDAISAVEAWYAERGLPPWITTPLPVCRAVHDALISRGWRAQPATPR